MADEQKEGCCGHKCCGCAKVLLGILLGIVLSVGACWLHGRCGHNACPVSGAVSAPAAPATPAKK